MVSIKTLTAVLFFPFIAQINQRRSTVAFLPFNSEVWVPPLV
jgi:hypothetical protein